MFDQIVYFGLFFYLITIFCIIRSDDPTALSHSENYDTAALYTLVDPTEDFRESQSPTQHAAIQIIILVATIILIIFVSVLLCNICCKHYRSPDNPFFGRASSVTSIQELIRERLQDRPPSYHESQNSLATRHHDEPPPYHEIATNTPSQTINTISSKILPNVNEQSVSVTSSEYDSPPSYNTSQCTLNTVFLVTSSIPLENRINFEVESEHGSTIFNNVMYI